MPEKGPLGRGLEHAIAAYRRNHPDVPVSSRWLAEQLAQRGTVVTFQYIDHLRNGTRTSAKLPLLVAMAEVLEAPLGTLVGMTQPPLDERARYIAAAVPHLPELAETMMGMSEASSQMLLDLATRLRQLEGLPSTPREM